MSKKNKCPDTPRHFSDKTSLLWAEYAGKSINSPAKLALFQAGLEALDRADQASMLVASEGLTTKTGKSGVVHKHPALSIEKEARAQFVKIWKALNLNYDMNY
jgi:phage terminase small subunit